MRVDRGFYNHWKTKKLIELAGDSGIVMLQKLWIHCEIKRQWLFENMSPDLLSAICEAKITGAKLLTILVDCGFVRIDGNTLAVHKWEVWNHGLLTNWANGAKGGRPLTGRYPAGNRPPTRRQPTANPPTRAGVGEKEVQEDMGYPRVIDPNSESLLQTGKGKEIGPLAGGIKAGKLCLVANSETASADDRRRAALKSFGGLVNAVASKLSPGDNS